MGAQSDDLLIIERSGTLYKATAGDVAALAGGAPLGLADFWAERVFASTDVSQPPFLGAAVSGGNNTGTIPSTSLLSYAPYGVMLRGNNAGAFSGYRYMTSSLTADAFGIGTRKFEALITWYEGFFALGFFDFNTVAGSDDPSDMACFWYSPGSSSYYANTRNNVASSYSTFGALTSGETYLFQIGVNADGTAADFTIIDASDGSEHLSATITTNIPTPPRSFGAGLFAYNPNYATQTNLMIIHRMGFGTIAGYQRARG